MCLISGDSCIEYVDVLCTGVMCPFPLCIGHCMRERKRDSFRQHTDGTGMKIGMVIVTIIKIKTNTVQDHYNNINEFWFTPLSSLVNSCFTPMLLLTSY